MNTYLHQTITTLYAMGFNKIMIDKALLQVWLYQKDNIPQSLHALYPLFEELLLSTEHNDHMDKSVRIFTLEERNGQMYHKPQDNPTGKDLLIDILQELLELGYTNIQAILYKKNRELVYKALDVLKQDGNISSIDGLYPLFIKCTMTCQPDEVWIIPASPPINSRISETSYDREYKSFSIQEVLDYLRK